MPRPGDERQPPIRQRRRAAAVEGPQPAAVLRPVVQPELRVALRAVRVHRVQERLDLAAVRKSCPSG